MRRLARVLALVVAGVPVLAGGVVLAPSAQAAACSGTTGVTVVVDYGSAGGGVVTRCAPGDPSSGLSALSAAGFAVTQVQTQPGFVCQIDSKPQTSCVRTPPASAYWAYWHAARGGSWSYSQTGAGSYDPAPGSVEGWSFGSGGQPGVSPPARTSAPKPSTSSTTTRPSGGSTTRTSGTGGSRGSGGSAGGAGTSSGSHSSAGGATGRTTSGATDGATTTGRATPTTGATATPDATTEAGGAAGVSSGASSAPVDRSAPVSSDQPAGSGVGLVVGVLLVLALGAGVGVVSLRRRRLES